MHDILICEAVMPAVYQGGGGPASDSPWWFGTMGLHKYIMQQ